MSRPLAVRILDLAADPRGDDPLPRLRAIRILFLAHLTTELGISFLRWRSLGVVDPLVLAAVAGGALALVFFRRTERFAAPLAALLLGVTILRYFPNVANHTFLLFLGLVTVSFFDFRDEEERGSALAALRWTAAIVLFATGVQKVLHGTYFHGEFLAFQIAHGERFAGFFRPWLPADEFQRLRDLGAAAGELGRAGTFRAYDTAPPPPGAGPYRLESPAGLALANSVWLFELGAPFLLLIPGTRAVAAIVVAVFLLSIELGAHEVLFGVLFVNLVLLFLRGNWVGRLLPVSLGFFAYLAGVHLGWFPSWFFN